MRSVSGCLTCRRRKLKCDEVKPQCGQCRKASRTCEPPELVFRHQQNSSLVSGGGRDGLDKYYAKRNSFTRADTWLEIPEQVTFVNVDPARDDDASGTQQTPMQDADAMDTPSSAQRSFSGGGGGGGIQGRREGSQGGSSHSFSPQSAPAAPVDTSSPQSVSTRGGGMSRASVPFSGLDQTMQYGSSGTPGEMRFSTDIDFILNPTSSDYNLGGRHTFQSGASQAVGSEIDVESPESHISRASQKPRPLETDPEVAFLLRYFSEVPGKWLDLYFLDAYFELEVPIKALSHPILKFAACAYAAKHLSRTRNKNDVPKGPEWRSHVPSTVTWPNADTVDWAWYSAKYYSQAINILREILQQSHDLTESPGQPISPSGGILQLTDESAAYAGISDETLAAMAILCNFEYMSASDAEWTRHLSGTMLVLDLTKTGVNSLMGSRPSKARKAIFWNLFRQDVFAAFILEGKIRLDIEDLRMWRAAGLELDDQGLVLPSIGEREGQMRDDMISNALIWILAKVINYIAIAKERQQEDDEVQSARRMSAGSHEPPTWTLREKWKSISHELDVWYDGLPDSFRPCARIARTASEPASESRPPKPATIPEIWFTSDMCGSTMQTYHLARMLLLVHRPQAGAVMALRPGAVMDFLNMYRTIEAELRHRSREIFGVALSAPTTSITLHQTQTIFVAAQCLVEEDERRMALDILRRVNSDLGWETGYRVQQLLKEWEGRGV